MITFSKNSWHYKMNFWVGQQDWGADAVYAKSICPYFWMTMWNIVSTSGLALAVFIFMSIFGAGILERVLELPIYGGSYAVTYLWVVGVVSILFCVICLILILSIVAFIMHSSFREDVLEHFGVTPPKYEDKEPSPILEYIRSVKTKVCPIIKFKE